MLCGTPPVRAWTACCILHGGKYRRNLCAKYVSRLFVDPLSLKKSEESCGCYAVQSLEKAGAGSTLTSCNFTPMFLCSSSKNPSATKLNFQRAVRVLYRLLTSLLRSAADEQFNDRCVAKRPCCVHDFTSDSVILRDVANFERAFPPGPTGTGKTKIARRLVKIVHGERFLIMCAWRHCRSCPAAPFVKMEATKYDEVRDRLWCSRHWILAFCLNHVVVNSRR